MTKKKSEAAHHACPNCAEMKRAMNKAIKAFAPNAARNNLMDENDVADYLHCSVQHVRAMRSKGDGPEFVTVGKRSVRYRPIDVRTYVRRKRRKSTADRDVRETRS